MESTKTDMLAEVPLFSLLAAQERGTLAERIDLIRVPKDTMLFERGDPGDSISIVQ